MIDITSFILPEIGSIPGLRHLEIFWRTLRRMSIYVVAAEMKGQQRREKMEQSKRNQRAHQTDKNTSVNIIRKISKKSSIRVVDTMKPIEMPG
jgi:flagellar biosynthesis component FlhA